jgi:predicted homoserine dehydrogenase-like protein
VDWARTSGFEVICAGKGTKYLPEYHQSTPDTVWGYYGFSKDQVACGDFNAQMFNSFLDGTKSAIEMAAIANATGLQPAKGGRAFPPCGVDDLPRVLGYRGVTKPKSHIRKRSESNNLILNYLQISGDVNKFTFAEDERARDQPKMRWKGVVLVQF